MKIASYFIIGIPSLLFGIGHLIGRTVPKNWFWDGLFSERTLKIMGWILGIFFTLFGLYLITKGIFDPHGKGLGINFKGNS
ncbi:MAG: hypothetical protein FWD39_03455 [Clostridiales bacterium]|nr:hypothetical protein [Clostridiales bacterium]